MGKAKSQTQATNNSIFHGNSIASNRTQYLTLINKCKKMLQYLRVFELQELLITLTGSKSKANIRKINLQDRILDLLNQNFKVVAPKIRDLYKLSWSARYHDIPVDCRASASVVPFSNNKISGYPIHGDVNLGKSPFYDVLATLIRPAALVPAITQRFQKAEFFFTLTPQQATNIANGNSTLVQLKFCLLATSCEQKRYFPPNLVVKVNNKLCPLTINVEPKGLLIPVDVTKNVFLIPNVRNVITIQWCQEDNTCSRYVVCSVFLVRKLTTTQLINRMTTKGIKLADHTKALIMKKLNEDADNEIVTTTLIVSLICPLGKMRMKIPSRASTCNHLQCFDASVFIEMNEFKPTWNCPVCDKPAVYQSLVIDGYFKEILESAMLSCDDNEIQLHKDGSWSAYSFRNKRKNIDDSIIICDEYEDNSVEKLPIATTSIGVKIPAVPGATSTGSFNNEQTYTTINDTVDLTSDVSDDSMPITKRIYRNLPVMMEIPKR